ncbi:MAG TPA: non-homologous end-joining DNA ligase [Candidatus Binatia bacterium]
MLATLIDEPFHRPGWVYEEKYDGYRILAYKEGAKVTLLSRNGLDRTASFRAIADDVARLRPRTLLLDGEAVAFDENLVSRFQLLQQGEAPVVFAAFDCLYVDGHDLRDRPLSERREILERVIEGSERIFPARRLATNGLTAHRIAKEKGFEGLIAKEASSAYVSGRSRRWLKVKVKQEDEFVIGGYTEPSGARSRFGALLVGGWRDGKLWYVGKVGTGFSEARLESLWRAFRPLVVAKPAFADPPRGRGITWLRPELVAQVAYTEWTADRKLRQPVFLGLRDDKRASEVTLPPNAP